MPTNWDELSSEARREFYTKYTAEYYRLYEECIGPLPGTRPGIAVPRTAHETTD